MVCPLSWSEFLHETIRNKNGLLQGKGQEEKLEECKDVVFHLIFMIESLISLGVIAQFMLLQELKSSDYFENMSWQIQLCKMQSPSFPHTYYLYFVLLKRKKAIFCLDNDIFFYLWSFFQTVTIV